LRTSIVSNGFRLVEEGLPPVFRSLELLGLSIDSLDAETNVRMGRAVCGRSISADQWMRLFDEAGRMGLPVKINTVVNAFNRNESMAAFIAEVGPLRWKVFQAIAVEGQNCHCSQEWVVDSDTFDRYVDRHLKAGVRPVVESEDVMRGSYAMISPDGRFYDSTSGAHRYSDPILAVGVEKAWSQVNFSHQKFADRTRSYGSENVDESRILASFR
jgi:radical S-adenosyl methionine domain-containing protein 2